MQADSFKFIKAATIMILLLSLPAVAAQFSWQQSHTKITPTGDFEWAPEPFKFETGGSIKYIDFENGSDDNHGTKEKPFKHHPWDSAATANAEKCSGVNTYVFKKGVIYRGTLAADESGSPGNPIRLTCDPAWGQGQAAIYGSVKITSGWEKCDTATAPKAIQSENIWYKDIGGSYHPRCLWEIRDGKILRLNLARTPNWTVSNPDDVKGEWWSWTDGKKVDNRIQASDSKNLTNPDSDYYEGAILWTEWVGVMGTPYPTQVEKYDPQTNSLTFEGF